MPEVVEEVHLSAEATCDGVFFKYDILYNFHKFGGTNLANSGRDGSVAAALSSEQKKLTTSTCFINTP